MTTKQTEEYLQKLRRLPGNKSCANCLVQSRLGFGAVCMKFSSFVCDNCKSAHQGFSHLCKSVSMSNWTMDEVRTLEGGNEACRAKWFANLTAQDRARYAPQEGSVILEDYKRFVQMAYEERRWLGTIAEASAVPSMTTAATTTRVAKQKPAAVSQPPPPPPPADDLMLLDFGSVLAAPSPPLQQQPQQSAFGFVQSTPSSQQQSSFGFMQPQQQLPPPQQQQSAFGFVQQPSPHPVNRASPAAYLAFDDPFIHLSPSPPVAASPKPPPPPQYQQRPKPTSTNDPFAGLF
ncbi:hypothetical protein BASA81_016500 [Batrachochytrium salamandrivorans]|nr:hypothetical protein BASA81_016500 [Batrachochytrium salamandrivorans]